MIPVSFSQVQFPFLRDSDILFLGFIQRHTKHFMWEGLQAGQDLSRWGNRYFGQYWVSRRLVQTGVFAPAPRASEFTNCLLPHRQSCPHWSVLCALLSHRESPLRGSSSWGLRDRPLRDRCLLRDFPCRSHFHRLEDPVPSPQFLKIQTSGLNVFPPFLKLGERGKKTENLSPGVEGTGLHWAIYYPG